MAVQAIDGNQSIPRWKTTVFWLTLGFVGWSIVGLIASINDSILVKVSGTVIATYSIVHIGLVVAILRETGFRLWSVAMCLIGLAAGEWLLLLFALMFLSWSINGFAP